MCYLLFCNEHDKKIGIFRYKNQSAIETNPINVDGVVVGWQAKFYEGALSGHKSDMLEMLSKAKRDYPEIQKICFYTNSEWGQYRGKEPKGKLEIEDEAKKKGIELEWRCRSYFESPFVVTDCKRSISYFFSQSDIIYDSLESLELHTKKVLGDIETNIAFGNENVVIDRSVILSDIDSASNKVLILSGDGGTGKTAIIKELYNRKNDNDAFYVHKATEFLVNSVNEFLSGISLKDFIVAHEGVNKKIVVIDSAENLLSIENIEPFKEYISTLIDENWNIWFTTRNSYLDDLSFQFLEVYKISYKSIPLPKLSDEELSELSEKYKFQLPVDNNLGKLIQIPFYLREYINNYQDNRDATYLDFRNSLWPRVIVKSSPHREQIFIKIAVERANTGRFFVKLDTAHSNIEIEKVLSDDGILGYESPHGYFITHDIYEEWALDKYLELQFSASLSALSFLEGIGQSLPIRRAFRRWLSNKLGNQDSEVILFIEESLAASDLSRLWRDEVLISLLLSDYSDTFFDSNSKNILENNLQLLKQICLLIRIGCKEIDNSFFENLGVLTPDILSMDYVITKPKGYGWEALIRFIYNNFDAIGMEGFHLILPIIHDWNKYNKVGNTTKYSSLLALKYYKWVINEDVYIRDDSVSKNVILTILYGVKEVKNEISKIIDNVIAYKWINHNDPYHLMSEYILSKMECFGVAVVLPEKVVALAKCLWIYEPPERDDFYGSDFNKVEHSFGVVHEDQKYFPASAYQTPAYSLLQTDLELALNFIIDFINEATEKYVSSTLDKNQVETVKVYLNDGVIVDQLINNRLWCMYRGTQINADILESMLMSLERFFLERGEKTAADMLEYYLYYILSRSRSAALSAVVASIVCAFHEKTFNIAKLLFKTKEFFIYDTNRLVLDTTHKSQLNSLKNFSINRMNEHHENERISACDNKHRKFSLENVLLHYQFFRSEEISDEDADRRLKEIWDILDIHYQNIPDKEKDSDEDKTWRLFLARMDKRKMSPVTRQVDNGIAIEFNPEIDSDLKEFSEKSLQKANDPFKNSALKIWSDSRLYRRDDYQKYENYENDPLSALSEARQIWSDLSNPENEVRLQFDRSIPSYVCAVLLRDFKEKLNIDDLGFCKEVILSYGSLFLQENYRYQISDGLVPSLAVLPLLIECFPDDKEKIGGLIVFALLCNDSIDMAGMDRINLVVINAVQPLWESNFGFALSLYVGYIFLAQKKKNMFDKYRQEAYTKREYKVNYSEFSKGFYEATSGVFECIVNETITEDIIENIEAIDNDILITAFQFAPFKNNCSNDVPFVKEIIEIISKHILSNDRDDRIDYSYRHHFLKRYSQYVLYLEIEEIPEYLKPFTDNFTATEGVSDLFKEIISSEDIIDNPDNFWCIWNLFKDQVIESVTNSSWRHYTDQMVESYLFARNPWKEDAFIWHTFTLERKDFFNDLSKGIGGETSFLYSLSKLLCGLGSIYLKEGVYWISNSLKSFNVDLSKDDSGNTIFYLERFMRKYIFLNREEVKKKPRLKASVIVILDFLVENGSITGYLLREDIA